MSYRRLDETIEVGQPGHIEDHEALHRKADYTFDVFDFGAVGDNVHDDTAAIQAAIDGAAEVGGGVVFLPSVEAGYRVTHTLLLRNRVVLTGQSRDRTVIVADHNQTVIGQSAPGTRIYGVHIRNLTIYTASSTAEIIIDWDGITGGEIYNVGSSGFTESTGLKVHSSGAPGLAIYNKFDHISIIAKIGLDVDGTNENTFIACRFTGSAQVGGIGIVVRGTANNNGFYTTGVEGSHYGIFIDGAGTYGNTFIGTRHEQNHIGIYIADGRTNVFLYPYFSSVDTKYESHSTWANVLMEAPGIDNAKFAMHFSDDIGMYSGSESPEGRVSAVVGSLYLRDDGGNGTTMYTKFWGTSNTGWRPVPGTATEPYVTANVTENRTYDADNTSPEGLADILGTLIADLQSTGIIA